MNYRHIYHAGGAADVFKHAVLARILLYLQRKDAALRVIDTHAGAGCYDLSSPQAQRTGEWAGGIGRLVLHPPTGPAAALLEPYLAAVRALNPAGGLTLYPGSPVLVRQLLRRRDRLTAIEIQPEAAVALKARFAGDIQVRVLALDGWLALKAHLPPQERRGLVLVDPPFEAEGEFARLAAGLVAAHRRWPGGVYVLWYPVKDRREGERFRAGLAASGMPRILDARLETRAPSAEPRLDGSGLVVVNPPFTLVDELKLLLPALAETLADVPGTARWHVAWLAGEAPPEG